MEGALMKEREYILATNLAKLRAAEQILGDVFLYGVDDTKANRAAFIRAHAAVDKLREYHEREVERLSEGEED
jgi:hypothetical protein